MPIRAIAGLVATIAVACSHPGAPAGPSPHEFARVPMSLQGVHPVVEARVNGQALRLLIDTGADQNVLSTQTVARLGLAVSRQTVSGQGAAGGYGAVPWVDLGAIGLGDALLNNQIGFVVALPEKANVDGILGLPLFARFVATLDYEAGELVLESAPDFRPPSDVQALPLRSEGGKMLVRAAVAGIDGWC
jgi:predicted aspartyl protease